MLTSHRATEDANEALVKAAKVNSPPSRDVHDSLVSRCLPLLDYVQCEVLFIIRIYMFYSDGVYEGRKDCHEVIKTCDGLMEGGCRGWLPLAFQPYLLTFQLVSCKVVSDQWLFRGMPFRTM